MLLSKIRLNPKLIFQSPLDKDLSKKAIKGSLISVLSQVSSLIIGMLNTIVLARLLVPDDFGLIGMVTVVINLAIMFKDAGLSMATIQQDKISNGQISTLFWINASISIVLGLFILVASPLIASFYSRPELIDITLWLSLSFIIEGFTIQHSALLRRHMQFTGLAINGIIVQVIALLVGITMAKAGFGYWALVGSVVARSFTRLLVIYFLCPWLPQRPKKTQGVKMMLKFGGHLTGGELANYFSKNLDNILIGKFIGASSLGLYSKAYNLIQMPINQIQGPLIAVAVPVMSTLKNDPVRFARYYEKLLDIIISFSMPLSVYCFIEADFLITALLGQKWLGAIPVFRILSVVGIITSISSTIGLVMISCGKTKRYLNLAIFNSILNSLAIIVGLPFGIEGIAKAMVIIVIVRLFPSLYYGFNNTPIKVPDFLKVAFLPSLTSLASGFFILLVKYFWQINTFYYHFLIGSVFFTLIIVFSIIRPKTRKTITIVLKSIFFK